MTRLWIALCSAALVALVGARAQQREQARRDGVHLLPLLHLFPGDADYTFGDGIHPDEEGHRRIAEAIAAAVAAEGWLRRTPQAGLPGCR